MSTALLNNNLVVGITMGDPSGIGAEVTAKAVCRLKLGKRIKLVLIGDKFVFSKFIKKLPENCAILDLKNVSRNNFKFGKISSAYGRAAIEYLDCATYLLKKKAIDCLVTAPINKEAVHLAGFKFPGHTEYLANAFKTRHFVMMFATKTLKVSLVTRHIPLKEVSGNLSVANIYQTISLSHDYFEKYFGIKNPRIAVCGLNPHAGEEGLLGKEEGLIIRPAVKKAKTKYKNISGPHPSDTVFHAACKGEFDCIICMYHDQAMIPVKTLFFNQLVNLTLGLPFVRSSAAHGTAYDIAAKNIANEGSMLEAIKLAINLTLKNKCNG